VTKNDFIKRLAARFGSRRQAADALDAVLEEVTAVLGEGGSVNLTGFGKFHVAERAPRRGVNPRTGEAIDVPGGPAPRFTAGAALKARVRS
jgi:DNA-binding protein HU-beta